MPTDLAQFIQQMPMVDSHEHMRKENEYLEQGPDLLQALFQNYVPADLTVAGASQEVLKKRLKTLDCCMHKTSQVVLFPYTYPGTFQKTLRQQEQWRHNWGFGLMR